MPATVLVTGGTGTLGRRVVPRLRDAGCDVRVLTRRHREDGDGVRYVTGDLARDTGLDAAVDGVATVVHCATSYKGDVAATHHLVRAAAPARSGTPPHLVYISIVGVDRIPVVSPVDRAMFGYTASKLDTERVVADSGLPWTTLRATQFHDLILMAARKLAALPVAVVPAGFRFQPVDADDVAARLVELATGAPAGRVPDLGGPTVYPAADLMRGYLAAVHRRRPVLEIPLPGRAAHAYRSGANLAPDHATGHGTWEDFLAARVPQRSPNGW